MKSEKILLLCGVAAVALAAVYLLRRSVTSVSFSDIMNPPIVPGVDPRTLGSN